MNTYITRQLQRFCLNVNRKRNSERKHSRPWTSGGSFGNNRGRVEIVGGENTSTWCYVPRVRPYGEDRWCSLPDERRLTEWLSHCVSGTPRPDLAARLSPLSQCQRNGSTGAFALEKKKLWLRYRRFGLGRTRGVLPRSGRRVLPERSWAADWLKRAAGGPTNASPPPPWRRPRAAMVEISSFPSEGRRM